MLIACSFLVPSISNAFCFDEAGGAFGINPFLLRGIARVESNLNPAAINRNTNGSVDIGLMQVNSSWVSSMGFDAVRLRSDPCYNVMSGAKILKLCIDRHGYTWEAVGCYNAVSRNKRVNYSWRVFDMLKAQGKKESNRLRVKGQSGSAAGRQAAGEVVIPSLSFSIRDNAAIE
ncbi:MAG: hypothetical protein OHK0032_11940 [Thermodesulfovibrionales bacterium]